MPIIPMRLEGTTDTRMERYTFSCTERDSPDEPVLPRGGESMGRCRTGGASGMQRGDRGWRSEGNGHIFCRTAADGHSEERAAQVPQERGKGPALHPSAAERGNRH